MTAPGPNRPAGIPLPALRWRGFTLQLFLFTVLPLTLLLLVIAFGSSALHHESMRSLVGDRDLRAVRAAANSLRLEAERRAALLDALAYQAAGGASSGAGSSAGSSAGSGADGGDANAFLEQAAARYNFDGGLALFDADGRLVARSAEAVPALLNAPTTGAENGARMEIAPTGESWLILASARPGALTLAGALSPEALAGTILSGIASSASTMLLISGEGELLYQAGALDHGPPLPERPGVADVLRGESGVNFIPAGSGGHQEHGGEHVVAFAPVEPFGWGLVLEEPWEATASPLLRLSQSAPLILAPVLVLAIFALWFGARQIVQPLQALERRAGQLALGDPGAIRQPVGGIREINNLQDALIEMTAALQSAQDALRGYIGALTAGVENERRALARELHDDTLQALIALNQHVQLASLRAEDPAQRQSLQDLQARVTQTMASLRRAIGGLRPIYLEDLGLVAALSMLARETAQASGMEVTFDLRGTEQRLPPETELAFYRITQEALNNAAHHAQAQRAAVVLAFENSAARLTITDDGEGFAVPGDPNAFARLGHYGLLGMRERADLAGADFEIQSNLGAGTKVQVVWKG